MQRGELLAVGLVVLIVAVSISLVPTERRASSPTLRAIDWSDVREDPQRSVALTWCGAPAFPSAQAETAVQRLIEQTFNVQITSVFLDWNAYRNRRALAFSAGDVPTVCWDGDPTQLRRNVTNGFVLELPYDVIRKFAPHYVEQINRVAPQAWLFPRIGGRNFGLPTVAPSDVFPYVPVWRMDWLRKVGIDHTPQTLGEMHEALRKFRFADPDGDGARDTYGMSPNLNWWLFCADIFAAFGVLPQDFVLRDGKVVWGGIQPETRQALALLRQWYAEGLIDPDFATATGSSGSTGPKLINGRIGYYYEQSGWEDFQGGDANSLQSSVRALNPSAELAPGKPLIGPDGQRLGRVWGGPAHILWFGAQATPEQVVRVLKILDRLAVDTDLYVTSRLGRRGETWDYSPKKGPYFLPPFDERGQAERNLLMTDLEGAYGFFSPCAQPLDRLGDYLPAGKAAFRDEYSKPTWGLRNAIGKSDVVPSAARYLDDLRQFQTTEFCKIIRGDVPLDAFDAFAARWKVRGGDILTQEANQVFHEAASVYRRVGVDAEGRTE